jgi:hypothetical protein
MSWQASMIDGNELYFFLHELMSSWQFMNSQLVHDFLSQLNNTLFLFLSELVDLFVAGRDQSAADQPNNLAEGHPPLQPL